MNVNPNGIPVLASSVVLAASSLACCWSIRYLYKNLIAEKEIQRCSENLQWEIDIDLHSREYREKLLADIKVFEEEHTQNPADAQILKNWAEALINLVHGTPGETDFNKTQQCYGEAKSHLEKALEINPDDHEARLKLGEVLYCIIFTLKMERDVFIEICHAAIGHFEKVLEKAPGLDKQSILGTLLKEIKKLLPTNLSKLKAPEVHKDSMLGKMQKNMATEPESSGLKDMEDDEKDEKLSTILAFKHKWESAKIKKTKYPVAMAGFCKAISFDPYVDNQKFVKWNFGSWSDNSRRPQRRRALSRGRVG